MSGAKAPNKEDLRFLLTSANRTFQKCVGPEDVVSVRCGIRPLAVPRDFSREVYPLDLSRRHHVAVHRESRAISIYGGKLTSSVTVANRVAELLGRWVAPRHTRPTPAGMPPEMTYHAELGHDFVTAEWARDQEFCLNLEDYLRRRTSIAQWTSRMGLGRDGSGAEPLRKIAAAFTAGPAEAEAMMNCYEKRVRDMFDPLLAL